MMIKLLEEIDELLAFLEDTAHGEEGNRITEMRYRILTELSNSHKHGVMQVPQFEELLQVRLDELPYTKHLDDGQYNDGQAYGFECGARWAYEKLSSGTAVGNSAAGRCVSVGKCVPPVAA